MIDMIDMIEDMIEDMIGVEVELELV